METKTTMTRNKRNDAGQVRQNKSGSWSAVYTDPEGKRVSLKGTFASERLAKAALRGVLADMDRGDYFDEANGNVLFATVARDNLEDRRGDLKPGTMRNYETLLTTTLLPEFGHLRVRDITVRRIERWWGQHSGTPVNRRNGYFLLKSVLDAAYRWGYIRENPAKVAMAGRDVAEPRPTFTITDFSFVMAFVPTELHAVLWVTFTAHLRISEACGLNRGDFDPATGRLFVQRQLSGIGGNHLAKTKTKATKDITPLHPGVQILTDHLAATSGPRDDPMFLGVRGGRISQRSIRTQWAKATALAAMPNMHVHDLRHIGLTEVGRSGVGLREIQWRGGHASITSAARYQHTSVDRDAEVAELANARISAMSGIEGDDR